MLPILVTLAAAVGSPPVIAGYRQIALAEANVRDGQFASAARSYEAAARLLPWRSDLWEQAGSAAYATGDGRDAIRLLTHAAQTTSISARAWDELGSAYWADAQRAQAIAAWESGSNADPRDAELLDRLAAAYHEQEAYDKEEAAARDRLQLGQDAVAHFRLGLLQAATNPESAMQEVTEAASLDAGFAPAANTLHAAWRAAVQESSPSARTVVLSRGLAILEEWGLAMRGFQLATEMDANNAEAWAWLGEARQHKGQDGAAELERALLLGPQDSIVHALRGLYFRREGRNQDAIDEYRRAGQINPHSAAIAGSLGEAYAARGDLISALDAYQRATSLAPDDPTYWRVLAAFCADNSVHLLDVGIPAARKALQLSPKDPDVIDTVGWAYAQSGYIDEARKTLQQAAELAPELGSAHVHLAVIYLRIGANDQALGELKLALGTDREAPAAQTALQLLHTYFPSFEIPPFGDRP
jgi:tetratricopeptide (TPR) repeat protein